MTVGVLAPHRDRAIGTRLLRHALNEGSKDAFLTHAYLHVQTNNADAIAFYKRFGFEAVSYTHLTLPTILLV